MKEYRLPIIEYITPSGGSCQRCMDMGRYSVGSFPILPGEHIYLDADKWHVCNDCYRDMQREGKIW